MPKFNKKGFVKIQSERYQDTIILCKFEWIAKQAARKKHIAYSVEELEEFRKMSTADQDIWHAQKKIFGGHYVGTIQKA